MFYSLKEVGKRLGVGRTTVLKLIATGKLQKVQISERRVGVTSTSLQAFMNSLIC